jgi:hypothetical protein
MVNHPLGDVCVQIQRHHHGEVGADALAHTLQHQTLGIFVALAHHGAVQCQQD